MDLRAEWAALDHMADRWHARHAHITDTAVCREIRDDDAFVGAAAMLALGMDKTTLAVMLMAAVVRIDAER
jgi:hypothetical protein